MKRKKKTDNVTTTFLYVLAIVSILGFASIVGTAWFKLNFLDSILSGLLLVVLGIGLVIEGQIRNWNKYTKKTFNSNAIAHIITGIVGILSIIAGIFDIIGYMSELLLATKGMIATFAIIIIIIETWLVD